MEPRTEELAGRVCTVPTDGPEADGTLTRDSTTMVMVEVVAGTVDGTLNPTGGVIRPDPDAPGLGLTFRAVDAEQFRVR